MSIVFIGENLGISSGHARPAYFLANQLKKDKYDVKIITNSPEKASKKEKYLKSKIKTEKLDFLDIRFYINNNNKKADLKNELKKAQYIHFFDFTSYKKLKKEFPFIIKKKLIYSLNTKLKYELNDLLSLKGTSINTILHKELIITMLIPNFVYNFLFKDFFKVVVHSDYVSKWAKQKLNLTNVVNIPIPINTGAIKKNPIKNKDNLTFGYFGGISYPRGTMDLIKSFLNKRFKKDKLIIDGILLHGKEGEEISDFFKRNKKRNMQLRVIMHDDLNVFFKECDVMVLPFRAARGALPPLVILEAMSAGIPVISTKAIGISKIIKNYENGLLVNSGNTKELTAAMNNIKDYDLRVKIAKNAYNYVTKIHGMKNTKEQYLKKVLEY